MSAVQIVLQQIENVNLSARGIPIWTTQVDVSVATSDMMIDWTHTRDQDDITSWSIPMENETIDTNALITESKRLCQRYIDEIILPFSLCPWAAPALRAGSVQMSVITDKFDSGSDLDLAARKVRETLRTFEEHSTELVLVLLPLCSYARLEMDDLLRHIREGMGTDLDRKGELSFALAAFHPDADPDTETPERFIPYLRRSPDPMIQAVRKTVLDKLDPAHVGGTAYFDLENMSLDTLAAPPVEPLRARIARANLETVEEQGLSTLASRIETIIDDRRRTYERLRGRKV